MQTKKYQNNILMILQRLREKKKWPVKTEAKLNVTTHDLDDILDAKKPC
jgi:hypothetical protein